MNTLDGILNSLAAIERRLARLEVIEARISKLYYGTTEYLTVNNGSLVVNETSADVDFRVESNGNANMLVVDGGLDAVGIGGAAASGWELKVTGDAEVTGNAQIEGRLCFTAATELTISGGIVTATRANHTIDTESDAASDDLDTINGGSSGDILIIRPVTAARTIVAKDSTGNLNLAGDFSMDNSVDTLMLMNVGGTLWIELSRSDNGA